MADGRVTIDVEVDGKQIKTLVSDLDDLSNTSKKISGSLKHTTDEVEKLGESSQKASGKVSETGTNLKDLGDSGQKTSKDLKNVDSSLDSLGNSSSDATNGLKETSASLKDIEKDGSLAAKGVDTADSSLSDLGSSGSEATQGLKDTSGSLKEVGESGADAAKGADEASNAVKELSSSSTDVSQVSEAMNGISESTSKAAGSMVDTADATKKLGDEAGSTSDELEKQKGNTEGVGNESKKASVSIKDMAVSLGLVKIASAAFGVLKNSMDSAISRFDTFNSFPKVLGALGVSSEDAAKAIDNLSEGIDGLPTKLDTVASTTQQMYTSFNDIEKATDSTIALNNAMLGSGSSAAEAQRGTDQYIKMLQSGKVDMMSWNTLSQTMDVGLIKVAESFGYAGKTAKSDLYEALKSGEHTLDEFNDKLIEVGTGTGIMAQLAKENSLGIATSLSNLGNSAAKGLAKIIEAFDELSKKVTGKDIAQNIDNLKVIINKAFEMIVKAIQKSEGAFKVFGVVAKGTISVLKTLAPVIMGVVAAYTALKVIDGVASSIKTMNETIKAAKAAKEGMTLVIKAQTAAQATETAMTKAQTIAEMAQNGQLTIGTALYGLLTGQITLATVAKMAAAVASKVLGLALQTMIPIVGWVTLALGALVGAVIAVVKWFNKETEEGKKLNSTQKELSDSTKKLADDVKSSGDAYKENQANIKASATANKDLVKQIQELSDKENKSLGDKALLQAKIEQLNGSMEGLNLSYSSQKDALSMSNEELSKRIDLYEEQDKAASSQERLLEITKEQSLVEQKLSETNALREEWNKKLEEGSVKGREAKVALKELDEQEKELLTTQDELKVKYEETNIAFETSMQNMTDATQYATEQQKMALDDLSETQQKVIEEMKATFDGYKEHATDLFSSLNDDITMTVGDMQANLEKNQQVIDNWSKNIEALAARGIDDGLLEQMRNMGPEGAGHVQALVNASDEELQQLSETFAKGGEVSMTAMGTAFGEGAQEVIENATHLIDNVGDTITSQIEAANFAEKAGWIPKGMADGVNDNKDQVSNATQGMAKDAAESAANELGIHSPSRVFMEYGQYIVEGLVQGIEQGSSLLNGAITKLYQVMQQEATANAQQFTVVNSNMIIQTQAEFNKLQNIAQSAMNSMKNEMNNGAKQIDLITKKILESTKSEYNKLPNIAQTATTNMKSKMDSGMSSIANAVKGYVSRITSGFNGLPNQMNSVGYNAMMGLNSGLNSGSSAVLATANSIANQVASTMRSALDIHSPSRVIRDTVGRFIPEGLAVGIEQYAYKAYDALGDLTNGLTGGSTKEMALGLTDFGGNNVSINNIHKSSTPKSSSDSNFYELAKMLSNRPIIVSNQIDKREISRILAKPISSVQQEDERIRNLVNGGQV